MGLELARAALGLPTCERPARTSEIERDPASQFDLLILIDDRNLSEQVARAVGTFAQQLGNRRVVVPSRNNVRNQTGTLSGRAIIVGESLFRQNESGQPHAPEAWRARIQSLVTQQQAFLNACARQLPAHSRGPQLQPGSKYGVNKLNWSITYEVSEDDGLVLHNVSLQKGPTAVPRSMGKKISLPYLRVFFLSPAQRAAVQRRVELHPNSRLAGYRSRLVDFRLEPESAKPDPLTQLPNQSFAIHVTYAIDEIDGWKEGCIFLTQRYEFYQAVDPRHDPRQTCEPFATVPCARFKPIVRYNVVADSQPPRFQSLEAPQRLHFVIDEHITQDRLLTSFLGRSAPNGHNVGAVHAECFPFCLRPVAQPIVVSAVEPLKANPLAEEVVKAVIIDGDARKDGDFTWGNFHQTYKQLVNEPGGGDTEGLVHPGCPECVHIHWHWGAPANVAGALKGLRVPHQFGLGKPLMPANSNQDVVVALLKFSPGEAEEDPQDFRALNNGEKLASQAVVFWYAGRGYRPEDAFFTHGGFFTPRPAGDINDDGQVDQLDVDALRQLLKGFPAGRCEKLQGGLVQRCYQAIADLDGDGLIGTADLQFLERLVQIVPRRQMQRQHP